MATFSRRYQWEHRPAVGTSNGLSMFAALVFVAGFVLAIIAGIWFPDNATAVTILALCGVVCGAVALATGNVVPFLIAATSLVLIGATGAFTEFNFINRGMGDAFNDIGRHVAIFMAPAAVILAIGTALAFTQHPVEDVGTGDTTIRRAA